MPQNPSRNPDPCTVCTAHSGLEAAQRTMKWVLTGAVTIVIAAFGISAYGTRTLGDQMGHVQTELARVATVVEQVHEIQIKQDDTRERLRVVETLVDEM